MFQMFSQSIALLGYGFILGLKHALDADHVVTISTLISETKSLKKSSMLGAIWGVGHTLTLLITGTLVLIFQWSIPDKLTLSLEFLVGILLVVLGVDVLRKIFKENVHLHEHHHENGIVHTHLHTHSRGASHSHTHRSFLLGTLHGLAGSGVLVLLVLATVDDLFQGVLFILIFGLGSVLGMLVTSTFIALPFKFFGYFYHQSIRLGVGGTSIALGCFLMYEGAFLLANA